MEKTIYLILISAYFAIYAVYIIYREYKHRNKEYTPKEIFISIISLLIGAYFNYSYSQFVGVLNYLIWAFIAVFIADLIIRANLMIRLGRFFRKK